MMIAIKDGNKYWVADVSSRWAQAHDNGALVSCGLTVGSDLSKRSFNRIKTKHQTSIQEYNHSGCLSYCTLRGDNHCQW